MIALISRICLISALLWPAASYGQALYCFEGEKLDEVVKYLGPILKKEDSVEYLRFENCLRLSIGTQRLELFDKWLARRYRFRKTMGLRLDRPSNQVISHHNQEHCRLELIKKERQISKGARARVGQKSGARVKRAQRERESRSQLLVMVGKSVRQTVGERQVSLKCLRQGRTGHMLEISLSDQGQALATTVTVGTSEVDLGQVVDNLSHRDDQLSSRQGLTLKRGQRTTRTRYFIRMSGP